eukprot:g68029.t1
MYISASAHGGFLTGAPVQPMLYASNTTLCMAAALTCCAHRPVCSTLCLLEGLNDCTHCLSKRLMAFHQPVREESATVILI